MPRIVTVEALDHLVPDDPAARQARRDLMRIHRAMGTRSIVSRGWRALLAQGPARRQLKVLELGAGDGSLLLDMARAVGPGWPPVQLTLLDRQDIVSTATLAGFAEQGWAAEVQVADVLAWAASLDDAAPGTAPARWDVITTTLFLHHLERDQLDLLLAAVALRADLFFACEPKRGWLPLAGSHLVGALGANAVARQDAVLSVHAGFRDHEITAHWPRTGAIWRTREFDAGLFSHCVSAQRAETL